MGLPSSEFRPGSANGQLDVLVVDDDRGVREAVAATLKALGHHVRVAASLAEGHTQFRREAPQLVFLDLRLPDGNGLTLLEEIKRDTPHVDVVVITGYLDVDLAVRSMRLGAIDLLEKPFTDQQIAAVVREVAPPAATDGSGVYSTARWKVTQLVGSSEAFLATCRKIQLVAKTPHTTALLLGESGTGKELAARAIHSMSDRAEANFVAVNCAALSETLLEAELFGYEKGAFTGAAPSGKAGLFEAANGGTILLDEIGELASGLQAKILRALQERKIKRVGGLTERDVDVRVVASTNRDLKQMVAERQFREDLYYRLNVMPILLPPLRDRGEDVLLLAHHFLKKTANELGKNHLCGFHEGVLTRFQEYHWPGNARELRNVVEHASILAQGPVIQEADLMIGAGASRVPEPPSLAEGRVHLALPDFRIASAEKALIERALRETSGHKTRAAELLGINRATLYNKLKSYGIDSGTGSISSDSARSLPES